MVVVFLTSGELGIAELPIDEARRVREAEAAEAADILGVVRLAFLRYPDAGLAEHVETAAARLRDIIVEEQPDHVYAPHPSDGHADHRAAYAVACQALDAVQLDGWLHAYEVWTPLASCDEVVDISTVIDRKLAAIRSHRSQIARYAFDRAVRGLNEYRGALMAGSAYAEGFARMVRSRTLNEHGPRPFEREAAG